MIGLAHEEPRISSEIDGDVDDRTPMRMSETLVVSDG